MTQTILQMAKKLNLEKLDFLYMDQMKISGFLYESGLTLNNKLVHSFQMSVKDFTQQIQSHLQMKKWTSFFGHEEMIQYFHYKFTDFDQLYPTKVLLEFLALLSPDLNLTISFWYADKTKELSIWDHIALMTINFGHKKYAFAVSPRFDDKEE